MIHLVLKLGVESLYLAKNINVSHVSKCHMLSLTLKCIYFIYCVYDTCLSVCIDVRVYVLSIFSSQVFRLVHRPLYP